MLVRKNRVLVIGGPESIGEAIVKSLPSEWSSKVAICDSPGRAVEILGQQTPELILCCAPQSCPANKALLEAYQQCAAWRDVPLLFLPGRCACDPAHEIAGSASKPLLESSGVRGPLLRGLLGMLVGNTAISGLPKSARSTNPPPASPSLETRPDLDLGVDIPGSRKLDRPHPPVASVPPFSLAPAAPGGFSRRPDQFRQPASPAGANAGMPTNGTGIGRGIEGKQAVAAGSPIDSAKSPPAIQLALVRVLLVESHPPLRRQLALLIGRLPQALLVDEAGTLAEALAKITSSAPEFVFIAERLPDGSGFDLFSLKRSNALGICLLGNGELAARAFDCGAVDYIVMPLGIDRLQKAWDRFLAGRPAAGVDLESGHDPVNEAFVAVTNKERRLINFREIRRIIAFGEYSRVYWEDNKYILLRKPLKTWIKELPDKDFVRVHRQAIINLAFIELVKRLSNGRLQIKLRGATEQISVSTRMAPAFNKTLKTHWRQPPIAA